MGMLYMTQRLATYSNTIGAYYFSKYQIYEQI